MVAFGGVGEAWGFGWVSFGGEVGEVAVAAFPVGALAGFGCGRCGAAGVVGEVAIGLGNRALEVGVGVIRTDRVAGWAGVAGYPFGGPLVWLAGGVAVLGTLGRGRGRFIGVPISKLAHAVITTRPTNLRDNLRPASRALPMRSLSVTNVSP